jgi:hypothetical protein
MCESNIGRSTPKKVQTTNISGHEIRKRTDLSPARTAPEWRRSTNLSSRSARDIEKEPFIEIISKIERKIVVNANKNFNSIYLILL